MRRGHRALEHTADIRVQAWAPTREECIAEAIAGLVASFVEIEGARPEWSVDAELTATSDEDALVAALDEVIYVLDTRGGVPVAAALEAGEGTWRLHLELTPVAAVPLCGAVPKAASLHGLHLARTDEGEVTIDV
jgi:SHS2 domain-containing protein